MPRLEFTPWRDEVELIRVRQQLYPANGSKESDERRKACSRISMWKIRGNLPHAVESTACLTDAVLHDDPINSTFAVRAVYSTAFCRFVTGMIDSEQNAKRKKSMYQVGKGIGIPASFIELRHQATHEDLPSLVVLRRAGERALQWLYHNYWKCIDMPELPATFVEGGLETLNESAPKLRDRLREIVRAHLKSCLATRQAQNLDKVTVPSRYAAINTSREIVRLCQGRAEMQKELIAVLLERKMLIPSTKSLGSKMDHVFELWDDLLKRLTVHQRNFLLTLTDEMSILIIQRSLLDVRIDEYREAVAMWLEHIYTDKVWKGARLRGKLDVNTIMHTCMMNPNYWTLPLAVAIIEDPMYPGAKSRYSDIIFKAMKTYNIPYQRDNPETMEALANTQAVTVEDGKVPWVPTPIGCV